MFETLRSLMRNPASFLRDPIAWGALAVNLVPALGLFLWGWSLNTVVIFYWLENVLIGAVNLARIIASGVGHGAGGIAATVFTAPFFTVHYGMFCFVHGIFVLALFGGGPPMEGPAGPEPLGLLDSAAALVPNWPVALSAVLAWKLAMFALVYIGQGQFRKTDPASQMMAPYGRIIFLHIAIFAGAFAIAALGAPIWGVLILVAVKTLWDVAADVAEDRFARAPLKPLPAGAPQAE